MDNIHDSFITPPSGTHLNHDSYPYTPFCMHPSRVHTWIMILTLPPRTTPRSVICIHTSRVYTWIINPTLPPPHPVLSSVYIHPWYTPGKKFLPPPPPTTHTSRSVLSHPGYTCIMILTAYTHFKVHALIQVCLIQHTIFLQT